MSFDIASFAMGKASGGGGGSDIVAKTITANGTYNASSDNADGYSPVTVNVSGGGATPKGITNVECPFNKLSISGMEVTG